jgi:large subunit ribosomal protein L10
MNREQKAAVIEAIAAQIQDSHAIFAVDYRGISVPEIAELRGRLRPADATFKVVKNSLTERAADQAGAQDLKAFLEGPTALTFVRGDVATAAKAIAEYGRTLQLLPFKGGLVDGAPLDVEQLGSLSRLPAREVLYGQLVGVVAAPVSGLVRSLNALLGGLAVALGQVRDKIQAGELQAGAPSAAPAEDAAPPGGESEPAAEQPEAPESGETAQAEAAAPEAPESGEATAPEGDAGAGEQHSGPAAGTAQDDEAEASPEAQASGAEESSAKEE